MDKYTHGLLLPLLALIIFSFQPFHADAQIVTTIAGTGTLGYSGDGGAATNARLNRCSELTVDVHGNVIVSDENNHRVRMITPGGTITTIAGNGSGGFGGDGGPATSAKLYYPGGVAVDTAGNIYIADFYNSRIRKVSTTGIITTFAGNGATAFSGDGGPATAAELSQAFGVCTDLLGNVFIADYFNHVVRKVDPSGIIRTIAGTGGSAGYSGDGGQATLATLNQPVGVYADRAGNIYIAEQQNSIIRKVSPSGMISTIAGMGTFFGYSGDGGAATAAELNFPSAVYVDTCGYIFIADAYNHCIRKVSPAGTISTFAGTGTGGYTGDGGPATAATFNKASGIAGDGNGHIYIADLENGAVRKVTFVAPYISPIQGVNTLCISAQDTLSDSTAGGTWVCSSPGIASISATGVISPVGAGTTIITYSLPTCPLTFVTDTLQVDPLANAGTIIGADSLCQGQNSGLATDGLPGGIWVSQNTAIASVGAGTGMVYGLSPGIDTIKYLVSNACGRDTAYKLVRIKSFAECPDGVLQPGGYTGATFEAYPNPNTGNCSLYYASPNNIPVAITITDASGRTMTSLTIPANMREELSLPVPSGIYFITAHAGLETKTIRMTVVR